MAARNLKDELEALRRELRHVPEETEEAAAASSRAGVAGSDLERVLGELQERFSEAADDAEDIVAAHPFASVAAAFLLGLLVANLMGRGR